MRRGDDQLVPVVCLRVACQKVKERTGVFAELAAASEEAEIGVRAGGGWVVVPRGEVNISPNAVMLAADDQRSLAMGFEAYDPVDDVHAGFLKHAGLVDVVFLIEPCLKLDQCSDLFAVFRRACQSGDDRVGLGRAVQRHLDGEDVGVFRSMFDELDDRAERLVGMVDQDVLVANCGEDAFALERATGIWGS